MCCVGAMFHNTVQPAVFMCSIISFALFHFFLRRQLELINT